MRVASIGVAVRLGAALFLAGMSVARAADLGVRTEIWPERAAATVWTGPYVGAFAGYGWGQGRATAPYDPIPGFFYNFGGAPYVVDAHGFFGGATLGHNWQYGALIFGLEGEIGYLGLAGSALDPNGVAAGFPDTRTSVRSDFYAALYGRLGFAAGPALLYAKGGAAWLSLRPSTIDPCVAPPAGCGTETLSMTGGGIKTGWSVGAGVEWALSRQWSVKAEYAYFDFGRVELSGVSSAGDRYFQNIGHTAHTVKAGVNFRFGGGLW